MERTFWNEVYIAAIRTGNGTQTACDKADDAVIAQRVRSGNV